MCFSHCCLIFILLCCLVFIACDEAQQIMKPVIPPNQPSQDTRGIRIQITPTEDGNPGHGFGNRSVYINGIGVPVLKDDTLKMFPVGTLIIKEVNNDTNTFVQHVATMKKTDDPAYAAHNGWFYTLYTRQTETAKFVGVGGDVPGSTSDGCHTCHIQAPKDSVFTQLPTPDTAVEEVPTPSEPEPETTQEQPQETQTPEETDNAPAEPECPEDFFLFDGECIHEGQPGVGPGG